MYSISIWDIKQRLAKQLSFGVCLEFLLLLLFFFQRTIHYKAIKAVLHPPHRDFSLLMTFGAVLQLTPGGRYLLISLAGELSQRRECYFFQSL